MPDQVTIISSRTIADPNPARAGQPATWVMYRVGPTGDPRSVYLAKGGPTDAEVEQAIRADLARTAQLQGRSFSV